MTIPIPPVLAAGALCWRMVENEAHILLVRRTQHNDVSLPKGKLDPGETLPETAVREIAEETGLTITLGAPLGQVDYTLPRGREKMVFYWSAEIDEPSLAAARFSPNDEISALEWVAMGEVRERLSYPHDIAIVDSFAERLAAGNARTFALIALRHAKTVPPESWDGPDATRPLLQRGVDQAASIAQGLAAYRPSRILSSTAARCLATVAPLSRLIARGAKELAGLSQDAHELGEDEVQAIVAKRIAKKRNALLCSHGPVLPEILAEIARATGTPQSAAIREAAMLAPGEYTVVHISLENSTGGIVALETHGPSAD